MIGFDVAAEDQRRMRGGSWQQEDQIRLTQLKSTLLWSYRVCEGVEKSFVIESINCELRLSDIYERVGFESKDAEASDTRPAST